MKKQSTPKQNITNITKKVSSRVKKPRNYVVGSHDGQIFAQVPYTVHDFKHAILIVSLAINMFLLTLWLTTQVSQAYAISVARFILN